MDRVNAGAEGTMDQPDTNIELQGKKVYVPVIPIQGGDAATAQPDSATLSHQPAAAGAGTGAAEHQQHQQHEQGHHTRTVGEMTWPGVSGTAAGHGKSLGQRVKEAIPGTREHEAKKIGDGY